MIEKTGIDSLPLNVSLGLACAEILAQSKLINMLSVNCFNVLFKKVTTYVLGINLVQPFISNTFS
jgi:hypothetical protein